MKWSAPNLTILLLGFIKSHYTLTLCHLLCTIQFPPAKHTVGHWGYYRMLGEEAKCVNARGNSLSFLFFLFFYNCHIGTLHGCQLRCDWQAFVSSWKMFVTVYNHIRAKPNLIAASPLIGAKTKLYSLTGTWKANKTSGTPGREVEVVGGTKRDRQDGGQT